METNRSLRVFDTKVDAGMVSAPMLWHMKRPASANKDCSIVYILDVDPNLSPNNSYLSGEENAGNVYVSRFCLPGRRSPKRIEHNKALFENGPKQCKTLTNKNRWKTGPNGFVSN